MAAGFGLFVSEEALNVWVCPLYWYPRLCSSSIPTLFRTCTTLYLFILHSGFIVDNCIDFFMMQVGIDLTRIAATSRRFFSGHRLHTPWTQTGRPAQTVYVCRKEISDIQCHTFLQSTPFCKKIEPWIYKRLLQKTHRLLNSVRNVSMRLDLGAFKLEATSIS